MDTAIENRAKPRSRLLPTSPPGQAGVADDTESAKPAELGVPPQQAVSTTAETTAAFIPTLLGLSSTRAYKAWLDVFQRILKNVLLLVFFGFFWFELLNRWQIYVLIVISFVCYCYNNKNNQGRTSRARHYAVYWIIVAFSLPSIVRPGGLVLLDAIEIVADLHSRPSDRAFTEIQVQETFEQRAAFVTWLAYFLVGLGLPAVYPGIVSFVPSHRIRLALLAALSVAFFVPLILDDNPYFFSHCFVYTRFVARGVASRMSRRAIKRARGVVVFVRDGPQTGMLWLRLVSGWLSVMCWIGMGAYYKYESLGSNGFRVLRLAPRSRWTLKAQLEPARVDQESPAHDQYEAISYRWGSGWAIYPILIDGRYLCVNRTAFKLLRGLQHPHEPRTIWIDAICINQAGVNAEDGETDYGERNRQVAMMGSIYRNASRVVAWVGDSSRGAGALTVLRAIATNQPSAPKEYWNHQEIRELLQGDGYKWQKVTELFRSDFFGRRWIIQELVLAKDVVLKHGHEELPWSDMSVCLSRDNSLKDSVMAWSDEIMTGIAWATKIAFIRFLVWGVDANEETLERLSPALRDFAQAIIDSRDGGGTGIGCLPLGTLLGLSTGFQATEPKDAVYAVLGLARDEWKGRITIDYSNHTSEAQVVQDATRFVLTTPSEQLDLLQHAGCGYSGGPEMWVDPISLRRLRPRKTFSLFARNPKPRDLALSSWVPHYNTSYLEHPIFDDQGYWAGRPKGGPGKEINEVADENGEIIPALISMSASAVGCIAQMGGVYTAADDEKAENLCLRRFLTEAARLASHISRDQYHPEDVDNVIWRTIFGDCEAQRGPPFQDEELGRLRAATLCVADLTPPWPGPAPAIDRADVSRADIRRAMSALHKASLARRLAITDRGHLGLVPPGSVVGDLVCIIWGASMPFVVRQLARRQQEDTTDRDEHVLVGGCYLHGFMLGQATPREYPATTMIFR